MDHRLLVWIGVCLRLPLWSFGLIQVWHGHTGFWFETSVGIYAFVFFSIWSAVMVYLRLQKTQGIKPRTTSPGRIGFSEILIFFGLIIGFRALIYSGLIILFIPGFSGWKQRIAMLLSGLLWTPLILHVAVYLNIWIVVALFIILAAYIIINFHRSESRTRHTDWVHKEYLFLCLRNRKFSAIILFTFLVSLTLLAGHSSNDAEMRLNTIPTKGHRIESWAVEMDENQKTQFQGAEVFKRIYSFDGEKVLLFVVLAPDGSRVIHRPEICLKGSGWSISNREKFPVGETLVSSVGLTKGQKTASCCFWFGYGSSKCATYNQFILNRLAGALMFWRKRSPGYLVLMQSMPGQPVDFKQLFLSHEGFFSNLGW